MSKRYHKVVDYDDALWEDLSDQLDELDLEIQRREKL